jgi:hypothetical protein
MVRVNVAQPVSVFLPPSPRLYGDAARAGDNTRTHEGGFAVAFSPRDELRRAVVCCLLGENQFYEDGVALADRIAGLVAGVEPAEAMEAMQEARVRQGLRHAPLLVAVEAARRPECRPLLRSALGPVLRTPRDAMDLLALYWQRQGKDRPLPHAFKAAVRDGFARWTEYQIRKYATLGNVGVRLRDSAFLCHPKPQEGRTDLLKALADDALTAPETWEARLSRAGADGDRAGIWRELLAGRKLGALALVRNLRNMAEAGLAPEEIAPALDACRAGDVWPWQALAAAREAPALAGSLADLMVRSCGRMPRLPGTTGVLVDVSGSMGDPLSQRGTMTRMDAACGVAVVAREVCDAVRIFTFSNHLAEVQATAARGLALAEAIKGSQAHGGTYLAQALNVLATALGREPLSRLLIVTDEQAHDGGLLHASAFGRVTIANVASYQNGVRHSGPVDRIDGWSANLLRYVAEREGIAASEPVEEDAAG